MREEDLPSNVKNLFMESVSDSRALRVIRHTHNVLEVQRKNCPTKFRTVNIETRKCSCGLYKEHGVPCRHFCAAILFLKGCPHDFLAPEHQLETLKRTDIGTTIPVDQNSLQGDGLKPPSKQKGVVVRKKKESDRLRKRDQEGR